MEVAYLEAWPYFWKTIRHHTSVKATEKVYMLVKIKDEDGTSTLLKIWHLSTSPHSITSKNRHRHLHRRQNPKYHKFVITEMTSISL